MDLGAMPRLWNVTVAASRNLATEALRLRSALPLGSGQMRAPPPLSTTSLRLSLLFPWQPRLTPEAGAAPAGAGG